MQKTKHCAWLVWLIAASFYSIEFFQRVSPTVMASSIMHDLQLGPAHYAFIISLYFYACAIAQIPVGYILDRYRLRYVLALACLSVSLGTLIFALSHASIYLALSRILVGIGSAFAFIGVLKLSNNWFSSRQYPFIVGLTNTVGILGAIFGQTPFAHFMHHYGWRHGLLVVAIVGVVISALMVLLIRNNPPGFNQSLPCSNLNKQQLRQTLFHRQTWLTAIYAGLMVAPIIAFAELWGVHFLANVYHYPRTIAATVNTCIFIGIAVGGPANGFINRYIKSKKTILLIGNVMALVMLLLSLLLNHLNSVLMGIILFLFGFFTSSMLLTFSMNKERHPGTVSALVVAFTNMVILIFGALYQDATGLLLKLFKEHSMVAMNPSHIYRYAMLILPITLAINLIILYTIKEKTNVE